MLVAERKGVGGRVLGALEGLVCVLVAGCCGVVVLGLGTWMLGLGP